MEYIDKTQEILSNYLCETEYILMELLSRKPYCGNAKIITNLDLGFPHDVIRLAGGFATGMALRWNSLVPFVPVDICMNVCTVSIYEVSCEATSLFTEQKIKCMVSNLGNSSYKANFHRGNHFLALMKSVSEDKFYIIIHSSAAEFETLFNGLYPVEGNYIFENVKVYKSKERYIRYIDGTVAELFCRMADNLYTYNENRHDFIMSALLGNLALVKGISHYHHYGMPDSRTALIGSHLLKCGDISPLLTRPGENIYLIKYNDVLDNSLKLDFNKNYFITPHGYGKKHKDCPLIRYDKDNNKLTVDSVEYNVKYGESLRDNPALGLRECTHQEYFSYLSKHYDYTVEQELIQLASYNKNGFIKWKV